MSKKLRSVETAKNRLRLKHSLSKNDKTICLTMIVKNESKNMVRLFNSVKPIIDYISIVDTGSTDNTPEIIKNWCVQNNIKHAVHHEKFKDFAYNRTHSVQMAQKTFPNVDYLLLSDADFVWEINVDGKFNKKLLFDHKYLINQYNDNISYANIRLLSAKVDWECLCLTHEYWTECEKQTKHVGEIRSHSITTLRINDKEDGGCKSDKYTRDERLLLQGLSDQNLKPLHKSRYTFYLAQTYKCLGKYEDSIETYKKRVQLKGWFEEVYISYYQIGKCYNLLGELCKKAIEINKMEEKTEQCKEFLEKHKLINLTLDELTKRYDQHNDDAIKWYLDGWMYRPSRAESLHAAITLMRIIGRHQDAYNYAKIGKTIPLSGDSLFVEPKSYTEWVYDYELCIVCYYLKDKKEEGGNACAALLARDDLPENIRHRIELNCKFYL